MNTSLFTRTSLLSKVAPGHQLAKSFLDQFVNSLSCKRFWDCAQWDQQLLLSTNALSLQFNKVS